MPTRTRHRRSRRAFSLLEVMVATVLLTAVLLPIVASFESAYSQQKAAHQMAHAVYIAQCVFETIRYQLYDGDSRRCLLNDDPKEPSRPSPWERFLEEIEDPGKSRSLDQVKVVEVSGADVSKYFERFMRAEAGPDPRKASPGQPLTAATNPTLFRELYNYRAIIRRVPGSPVLDPGGAGRPEADMFEVNVEVEWIDAVGQTRRSTFWCAFTRRQFDRVAAATAKAGS